MLVSPLIPRAPSGPPSESWGLWCPSLRGEELADSLLTGEMSLLLLVWLTDCEPDTEGGFRGICHEGILGMEGVEGNCFLWGADKRGKENEASSETSL